MKYSRHGKIVILMMEALPNQEKFLTGHSLRSFSIEASKGGKLYSNNLAGSCEIFTPKYCMALDSYLNGQFCCNSVKSVNGRDMFSTSDL